MQNTIRSSYDFSLALSRQSEVRALTASRESLLNILAIESNPKARQTTQARVLEINASIQQLTK